MKTLPWLLSVIVHGLVLLMGGLSVQEAIVGIAPGRNSIEVNLVAAPSQPVSPPTPQPSPEEPVTPQDQPVVPPVAEVQQPPVPLDPASTVDTVPTAAPSAPTSEPPKPSHATAKLSKIHSPSHSTGKDSVTAQSLAGAIIDEEPDYLSNPAPIYPQAAKDQNQEGLVTLDVIVSTNGRSETIKISSSSGYHLLDDAAREAVEHYQFRPASLNGIKVRSHIQVPIRFRLDS